MEKTTVKGPADHTSVLVLARIGLIFCSNWKGAWLGHRGYSAPPHTIAGVKGLSSGEKWFCLEEKMW